MNGSSLDVEYLERAPYFRPGARWAQGAQAHSPRPFFRVFQFCFIEARW
jgi:hypothetical protein